MALVVFSVLSLDQLDFNWGEWWDLNVVHYSFSTSIFDLVLSSLLRSLIIIVLGLDCFAPLCSRAAQAPSYQTATSTTSSSSPSSSSPGKGYSSFDPHLQIYTPWSSTLARVGGLLFAFVLLVVNLPFLLAKILLFQNDPFNLFYLLVVIAAICGCVIEAPILLKLWFMKKRIHSLRATLRKMSATRTPGKDRGRGTSSPKGGPEHTPLLINAKDDTTDEDVPPNPVSAHRHHHRLRSDSITEIEDHGDVTVFHDFYDLTDSSEDGSDFEDFDEDAPEIYHDENGSPRLQATRIRQSIYFPGEEEEGTGAGGIPIPIPGSERQRAPSSVVGSFVSAREFLSDDEGRDSVRGSFRSVSSGSGDRISSVPVPPAEDETEGGAVSEGGGGGLAQLLALLKSAIGAPDLDKLRIQMPAWVHQGDSVLERNAMLDHPQYLSSIADEVTPITRMVAVVRFVLCKLRAQASIQKKPFNPIIGEQYLCHWPKTSVRYFSEQVSHHPPVSTFIYEDTARGVEFAGTNRAVTTFTGSAIKIAFSGQQVVVVHRPMDGEGGSAKRPPPSNIDNADGRAAAAVAQGAAEEYAVTLPDLYIRGILGRGSEPDFVGRAVITCWRTGCSAMLEFLEKPLFGGEMHRVEGKIIDEMGNVRYTLAGRWNSGPELTNLTTGATEPLFPLEREIRVRPVARQLTEQGEMESNRVWYSCSKAIRGEKWKVADRAKQAVEDLQRRYHRDMAKQAVPQYQPVYFDLVTNDPPTYRFAGEEAAKRRQGWFSNYRGGGHR